MFKKFLILIAALFIIFVLLIIQSAIIPPIDPDDTKMVKGKVVRIFEGGVKDIVFILENDPRTYYINRGLEEGLSIHSLKEKVLYKEVMIRYPEYWTPLDSKGRVKHLSELVYQRDTIFSEIDWSK